MLRFRGDFPFSVAVVGLVVVILMFLIMVIGLARKLGALTSSHDQERAEALRREAGRAQALGDEIRDELERLGLWERGDVHARRLNRAHHDRVLVLSRAVQIGTEASNARQDKRARRSQRLFLGLGLLCSVPIGVAVNLVTK